MCVNKGEQMNKHEIGSMTARGGFINEADICEKFANYKDDSEAKTWLSSSTLVILGFFFKASMATSGTDAAIAGIIL